MQEERQHKVRPVCFITGSGSGNGSTMARHIAAAGYDIALHHSGRDSGGAEETAEAVRSCGARCEIFAVNFMEKGAASRLFMQFREHFSRLDLFVANAGITTGGELVRMTEETFEQIYRVNWTGTYFSVQEAAKFMIEKGIQGSIVTVASNHYVNNWNGMSAYGSMKQAMVRFVEYCGLELAPHGIRVNCLAPGYIDHERPATPKWQAGKERISRSIPLKRYVLSTELADWALFLASPAGASYTGATVDIDGGARLQDCEQQ